MKLTISFALLFFHFSFASNGVAERVVAQFKKLPEPTKTTSDFENWSYHIAANTAISCWLDLNKPAKVPAPLDKFRGKMAYTFSFPTGKDVERLCRSVADKGFRPVCTHSTIWSEDLKKRRNDLPIDYVQLDRDMPLNLTGTIGCYQNADQVHKQTYVGVITAKWLTKPTKQSIMTPTGAKIMNVGTIQITAVGTKNLNGTEFIEPKMAVVLEK